MSEETLQSFFDANGKVAIALSGGTDSAFLLHRANASGADVLPVIVRTHLSRETEVERAIGLCLEEGLEPMVLDIDFLGIPEISANRADRCYHCKRAMFSAIRETAFGMGYPVIADGTNASDAEDDRPGMRAIRELGIVSPLRDAGLTKDRIRDLSRVDGLVTWDLPSDSCRATRVDTGVPLTRELLDTVECSEDAVRGLGFIGFRVRTDGTSARVEMPASQRDEAMGRSGEIWAALSGWFARISISEDVRDG